MSSPTLRRREFTAGVVTLLATAGLLLGACGTTATADDATDAPTATSQPPGESAATTSNPRTEGPTTEDATTEDPGATDPGATVEVSTIDYAYEGLPATIAVGTQIMMRNDSIGELHELIAMRLPDDEARPVSELLELPQAELEGMFAGEPAVVIIAPPGEDGFPVVGDGVMGEPGRYIVLCAIPTGADPEEYMNAPEGEGPPQVDGGPPHFVNGMWAELVVEAE